MDPAHLGELQRALKALASPNRLQLLLALQEPRRITDIALQPERPGTGAWGTAERRLTRQAVKEHLEELLALGAVMALQEDQETRYVVNHARLFEVTEQLREIATVKPRVDVPQDTVAHDHTVRAAKPPGPHLVLVRGVREGSVWPLGPAKGEGWLIGRSKEAEVSLDYDPYASSAHARVVAKEGRHFLVDLPGNTNGTFLNWQPMVRGGVAPLESGDLIGVGMSLLLYRR